MRLNQTEIASINQLARKHFGAETRVSLFGSRVDDQKKGGDIDLLVKNNDESRLTLIAKVQFLAELKRILGDQKIDVVFDNSLTRMKTNFYRSIKSQQIEL